MTKERLLIFLNEECRREHYYCDDAWFSCPLAENGCTNEDIDPRKCNCGTDEFNKRLDRIISNIQLKGVV